jgi:hemerythrin-like domain-containing protein
LNFVQGHNQYQGHAPDPKTLPGFGPCDAGSSGIKKGGTTMQARGPLMIEHRLIERMISVIKGVLAKSESEHEVDPLFVDTAVDFIRVYADRTHHGKEEDILFRELNKKALRSEDSRIMKELVEEHVFGRQTTKALVEANTRYRNGDENALADIVANLKTLTRFYPKHIDKEDKIFFPSSRTYFTDEEDQAMLAEFWEFDRKMIHEKYKSLIEGFESQK